MHKHSDRLEDYQASRPPSIGTANVLKLVLQTNTITSCMGMGAPEVKALGTSWPSGRFRRCRIGTIAKR